MPATETQGSMMLLCSVTGVEELYGLEIRAGPLILKGMMISYKITGWCMVRGKVEEPGQGVVL